MLASARRGRAFDATPETPLAADPRLTPDSDIYALAVDRVVSVAPLSLDLTSRVDRGEMETLLRGPAVL